LSVFQLRRENWQETQASAKKDKQRARESLAARLHKHKEDKEVEAVLREEEKATQRSMLDARRDDWQAQQASKRQEEMRERKSLSARLEKWRQEKEVASALDEQSREAARIELELRAQEQKDVEAYQASLRKARRESMAMRLVKAKEDVDWERGQATMIALALENDRELREADRACELAAQERERVRQRESLLVRQEKVKQERYLAEAAKQTARDEAAKEHELQSEVRKDVEHAAEESRERARWSLAQNLARKRLEKEADLQAHFTNLSDLHESFMLRSADTQDVEHYKQEQQQRRRMSISLRLDSWRQQRIEEAKEAQRQQVIALEEVSLFHICSPTNASPNPNPHPNP